MGSVRRGSGRVNVIMMGGLILGGLTNFRSRPVHKMWTWLLSRVHSSLLVACLLICSFTVFFN